MRLLLSVLIHVPRQDPFLQLSERILGRGEKKIFNELLRNSARAASRPSFFKILFYRFPEFVPIESLIPPEGSVFCEYNRVNGICRELFSGKSSTAFYEKAYFALGPVLHVPA